MRSWMVTRRSPYFASIAPLFRDLREESLQFGPVGIDTMLLSHPGCLLSYHHDYDAMLDQAVARAEAYAEAGASGFFAPGSRASASAWGGVPS